MFRIPKSIQKFDWKYAGREIVLIVMGILFALAINNWNEGRKKYDRETRVLQNLEASLETNLASINRYLSYHEDTYQNLQLLVKHLDAGKPYSDSLDTYFGSAIGASMILVDKSVYENIKDQGTDIITNDSIRIKVASLFEYDYKYLEKMAEITIGHLLHNIQPYYGKHFRDFRRMGTATPINYKFILNDPEYTGLLDWMRTNKEFEFPVFQRTKKKLLTILDMISRELEER